MNEIRECWKYFKNLIVLLSKVMVPIPNVQTHFLVTRLSKIEIMFILQDQSSSILKNTTRYVIRYMLG